MFKNTMLPVSGIAGSQSKCKFHPFCASAGLKAAAVNGLRASFPGTLTREFEEFLGITCGLDGTALGYLDFTAQWQEEEPLGVFRPCLTVAVDDQGRRWIAETHKNAGLPGPVWCAHQDLQVVEYVAEDISILIELLQTHALAGTTTAWLNGLANAARNACHRRGALAFQAHQTWSKDKLVRQWLLQLPRDARVFDLRDPRVARAWPYGMAGTTGRPHRCARDMLFAVSGLPAPSRWADYIGTLAWQQEIPVPGIVQRERAQATPSTRASPTEARQMGG